LANRLAVFEEQNKSLNEQLTGSFTDAENASNFDKIKDLAAIRHFMTSNFVSKEEATNRDGEITESLGQIEVMQ